MHWASLEKERSAGPPKKCDDYLQYSHTSEMNFCTISDSIKATRDWVALLVRGQLLPFLGHLREWQRAGGGVMGQP